MSKNKLINYETPRDILIKKEQVLELDKVLGTLSDREKQVIIWRLFDDLTFRECAEKFNLSRERIRQIESKALRKLRGNERFKTLCEIFDKECIWYERQKRIREYKKENSFFQIEKQYFQEREERKNKLKKELEIKNNYWNKVQKFTLVIHGKREDHPYFMPCKTNEEKIARIQAYAKYYEVDLEELKLIFKQEDMALIFASQNSISDTNSSQ